MPHVCVPQLGHSVETTLQEHPVDCRLVRKNTECQAECQHDSDALTQLRHKIKNTMKQCSGTANDHKRDLRLSPSFLSLSHHSTPRIMLFWCTPRRCGGREGCGHGVNGKGGPSRSGRQRVLGSDLQIGGCCRVVTDEVTGEQAAELAVMMTKIRSYSTSEA